MNEEERPPLGSDDRFRRCAFCGLVIVSYDANHDQICPTRFVSSAADAEVHRKKARAKYTACERGAQAAARRAGRVPPAVTAQKIDE